MCPWTTTDQQLKHILQLSTRRLEQAGRSESLLNGLESSAAGTRCVHDHGDTDQADEAAPAMSKRSGSTGGSTIVSASRPSCGRTQADPPPAHATRLQAARCGTCSGKWHGVSSRT
jgi:hypothetical protein